MHFLGFRYRTVFEFHHLSVFTFYKFMKFMYFFVGLYVPIKIVTLKSQGFCSDETNVFTVCLFRWR